MKLSDQAKAQKENELQQAGMMDLTDSIIEYTQGDYWTLLGQTRGHYYFTKEKLIFLGGLMGADNFVIDYKNIKDAKLKLIRCFLPTGIAVTALNPETGKEKKYVLSVMKRKEWLALIKEKAGLTS